MAALLGASSEGTPTGYPVNTQNTASAEIAQRDASESYDDANSASLSTLVDGSPAPELVSALRDWETTNDKKAEGLATKRGLPRDGAAREAATNESSVSAGNTNVKPFFRRSSGGSLALRMNEEDDQKTDDGARVVPLRGVAYASRGLAVPSLATIANELDACMGDNLRLDSATGITTFYDVPPWEASIDHRYRAEVPRQVTKSDSIACARWLCERFSEHHGSTSQVTSGLAMDAMLAVGMTHRRDSIQDFLMGLPEWDGVDRITSELPRIFGLDSSDDSRSAIFRWLVATVRRMANPGAPLEDILLVENASSVRQVVKSILSVMPEEFTVDTGLDFNPNHSSSFHRIVGKTLVVISDFASWKGNSPELISSFAGRSSDGKEFPHRRCGFALVSTEKMDTRVPARFHPVVSMFPSSELGYDERKLILSEAFSKIHTLSSSYRKSIFRASDDPWDVTIKQWVLENPEVEAITSNAVMRKILGMKIEKMERSHEMRVASIFYSMGWENKRRRLKAEEGEETSASSERATRVRMWVRPELNTSTHIEPETHPVPTLDENGVPTLAILEKTSEEMSSCVNEQKQELTKEGSPT